MKTLQELEELTYEEYLLLEQEDTNASGVWGYQVLEFDITDGYKHIRYANVDGVVEITTNYGNYELTFEAPFKTDECQAVINLAFDSNAKDYSEYDAKDIQEYVSYDDIDFTNDNIEFTQCWIPGA